MLYLNTQESLDTLAYSIERNQQRLPDQIAQSHLNGNGKISEATQEQILMAQQRLNWFEPHLSLIANVEGFLANFPNSSPYQQQWRKAIDKIGDLTVPQAVIKILAIHCDFLAAGWFVVEEAFLRMKGLLERGHESTLLEESFYRFQQYWEQLWQAFFDTTSPQGEAIMKTSFQGFSQISQQLSEVDL